MEELSGKKKIYFIGIGGIGMSALAIILKNRGFIVAGSDKAESSTTNNLVKRGIEVIIGHRVENITSDIDIIVNTNAVGEDNPEMIKAHQLNIPVYERAKMLDIVAKPKFTIGVSGTHGKTTTTSMVSKIFLRANLSPSLAIGGHIEEINGSGYEGEGKYFIYEACEAYASFLQLHPNMALITNIDADHLDYYENMENIKTAFAKYMTENIPPYGLIIYNKDDAPLHEVIEQHRPHNLVSVGIEATDADFVASEVKCYDFSSYFQVKQRGKLIGEFHVNVPGIHNVTNALLAIAAAKMNGIETDVIVKTLSEFKNAHRRFQVKFEGDKLIVIDDYAHHPSEIEATLKAAKNLSELKHAKLIAIFQPHLYSRTASFYKDFAKSLSRADNVVLTEIYAARESNTQNISSQIIVDELVKLTGNDKVVYTKNLNDIPATVKDILADNNNVIITLGAGDVWKVSDMFGYS